MTKEPGSAAREGPIAAARRASRRAIGELFHARVPLDGDRATVETEVIVHPSANTRLMGLYASGGIMCTDLSVSDTGTGIAPDDLERLFAIGFEET